MKNMNVTLTNVMPMPSSMSGSNTTFMFRKRPRHRQDALRRFLMPLCGVFLAGGLILWFVLANE
jgi:preprotein translocase subunit SecG